VFKEISCKNKSAYLHSLVNSSSDRIGGLPKKSEIFFFFQMNEDKVQDFRKQLAQLVPLITSSAQVKKDREQIDKNKTAPQDPKSPPPLLKLSGVNLSFTQKGLTLVREARTMCI